MAGVTQGRNPAGTDPLKGEHRLGWGSFTQTYERLKKYIERPTDPQSEKREQERVRRMEAVQGLKASPHWWIAEEIFNEQYERALNSVKNGVDPYQVIQVLEDTYESFDFTVFQGERALKRLAARRLAAHQRLMEARPPQSAGPEEPPPWPTNPRFQHLR